MKSEKIKLVFEATAKSGGLFLCDVISLNHDDDDDDDGDDDVLRIVSSCWLFLDLIGI